MLRQVIFRWKFSLWRLLLKKFTVFILIYSIFLQNINYAAQHQEDEVVLERNPRFQIFRALNIEEHKVLLKNWIKIAATKLVATSEYI